MNCFQLIFSPTGGHGTCCKSDHSDLAGGADHRLVRTELYSTCHSIQRS